MVKQITATNLRRILLEYYNKKDETGKKIPIIITGTFGIGKSAITKDTAKDIATQNKRKFVEWNRLTEEEKDSVASDLKSYFVYMDIRLSEYDSSDVKGLPDFKDNSCIIWKSPFWAKILSQPDSDGILLFDEINLATELVISSTYKILHDRIINESKINDNWFICCAGNLDDDRAYTHELASPVKDRGGEVQLLPPTISEWVDWAIKSDIDSRIIGFLSWKESNLHKVNFEDKQKFTTPRGWERVSILTKGLNDYPLMDLLIGSAISEGIAKEYIAFCKIKDSVKLEEIIKNPKLLRNITEISIRYFITTALAEKYKDSKVSFESIFEISEELDNIKCSEFVSLLWRLCLKYNKSKFSKDFTSKLLNNPLRDKFYKYLVE